jgi:hypothetical protein
VHGELADAVQVRLTGHGGDEGVDHALGKPADDLGESCTDDDSDSEVNDAAPHQEVLETLEHGPPVE